MELLHLLVAGLAQDLIGNLGPDDFSLGLFLCEGEVLSLAEVIVPDGCFELTLAVINWFCGLLALRSSGLSDGLFADIEERALFGDEESVVAVMGVGLDADLVCHLLLHSDLDELWGWFLGLAVNVVVLGLPRLGLV